MTDDEDEKTPPRAVKRPRSEWDADKRAMVGRDHRGGESQRHSAPNMTDSERHRHARRFQIGEIPEGLGGEESELVRHDITSPIAMLERELDAEDHEALRQLRRRRNKDTDDPVVIAYKLSKEIRRLREEERSNNEERANQLMELLDRQPNTEMRATLGAMQDEIERLRVEIGTRHSKTEGSVHENLAALLGSHRLVRTLAGFALTLALGSAGYVVASIKNSGADEVLRAQDRQAIKDLQQENRDLRRDLQRLKDKTP